MNEQEREASAELWDRRIYDVAVHIQNTSLAGAVLVAIFDGPWMDGDAPSSVGLVGKKGMDMFRIVRDLRDIAKMLEQQAGQVAEGQPFVAEHERTEPVRE